MRIRLYVVHGSHPCAAVEKALAIKNLKYSVTEWPPPLHAPLQKLIFGVRTVPGISIDGERLSGSRAIMRRLEQIAPRPPLFPDQEGRRAAVEEAERWGDVELQPVARELLWAAFRRHPQAMASYTANSRLSLPAGVIRLISPPISRIESRLNRTDEQVARADMARLPQQLDQVDGWIADGTLGDVEHPNAADLQICSTLRLLMTMGDVRPLIEGRPCAQLTLALFPDADGDLPPGVLRSA